MCTSARHQTHRNLNDDGKKLPRLASVDHVCLRSEGTPVQVPATLVANWSRAVVAVCRAIQVLELHGRSAQ